jgi:preprotein translocase subunit SecF
MIHIMKYKKIYLLFSGLILVPGIISLIFFGLKLDVDFTGGSVFEYQITGDQSRDEAVSTIKAVYQEENLEISQIYTEGKTIQIRTTPTDSAENDKIVQKLSESSTQIKEESFETVGPSIGQEQTKDAFKALAFASLGIMLYIAYAFRNIPKPYSSLRFGASAIIAMLHDAFMLLGVFSILGVLRNLQIDALFITAVLTVIGFSVHDSIVVFDRIRENINKLPPSWGFERIVNFSIVETLNRSFATSMTVLITLLSLYILGGLTIRHFVLALLIGITSGTYSSIFTASPILVIWEDYLARKNKRS